MDPVNGPVNGAVNTDAGPAFAGDLLLRLASDGVLVLAPEHADQLIAEITLTLDVVRARFGLLQLLCHCPTTPPEDSGHLDQVLVDVAFTEQTAPGRLERAMLGLPKYIRALEIAKARHPQPPR